MAESVTRFGAVDESFSATIDKMEGRLSGFEGSVLKTTAATVGKTAALAAAAVAVAAFATAVAVAAGYAKAFGAAMDFAEKIMDLKQRTGELASNLVILQRAFENSGLKADQVGPAIFRLQKIIGDAAAGSEKAREKLLGLGLSLEQLNGLSPAEQMEKVAEAIAKIEDPARRNAELIRIFGQDLGPKMAPLVAQFVAEMQKAEAQLGSFPRIVDQYAPALDTLKQNIDNLKNKFLEFAFGAAGPLADIFATLTERMLNFDAAGFGEKIGLEFRKALVDALIFIEDVSIMLGGIWEGMRDTVRPILAEIQTYFQSLADNVRPYIEAISEYFRNLDYRAIGLGIGEQFGYALQVARGLLADPSAIFGLYGKYLEYTFRLAADQLLSFFVTAVEVIGRAWLSLFNTDLMGSIANIFANAMILGLVQINLKFLDMVQGVMRFFSDLWNTVTSEGVSGFAKRLFDLIKNFGSDLFMALTNPLGFFTGKLASALLDGTKEGADAYKVNFDQATGGIIEKAKAGLEGMSNTASQNLKQGFSDAGNSLVAAVSEVVTKTEGFKSNLFGSAEAGERLKAAADVLAERGRSFMESSQVARDNIEAADADLKVTADLFTGPNGVAEATKQAAAATTQASQSTSAAFDKVTKSGQTVEQSMNRGSQNFSKEVVGAGTWFKQEVIGALGKMFDFTKGLATESTLQKVVGELQTLNRKLPQPVLS